MSTRELLRDLATAGCSIRFHNGRLQTTGPLTPELRSRIAKFRAPLISHLASSEVERLQNCGSLLEARRVEMEAAWAIQWTASVERICTGCGGIARRDGTQLCENCQTQSPALRLESA